MVGVDLHSIAAAAFEALFHKSGAQHVQEKGLLGDLDDRPTRAARFPVAAAHDRVQQAEFDIVILLPVPVVSQDLVGLLKDLVGLQVGVVDAQTWADQRPDSTFHRGNERVHQSGEQARQNCERAPQSDEPARQNDEPAHQINEPAHRNDESAHQNEERARQTNEPAHQIDESARRGHEPARGKARARSSVAVSPSGPPLLGRASRAPCLALSSLPRPRANQPKIG